MKLSDCIGSIILASQSPARKAVLESMGIKVTVHVTHADETHEGSDPGSIVALLARRKLDSAIKSLGDRECMLCCDTLVYCNGALVGKAHSPEEARGMLRSFSSQSQEVYSGYALLYSGRIIEGFDKAVVTFKALSDEQIDSYISTGEYIGAAGAYRIQGKARALIDSTQGDINTVIGLPLAALEQRLDELCR